MDYAKVYSERKENFMSEEVLGFEIESGKLKLFIRGVRINGTIKGL